MKKLLAVGMLLLLLSALAVGAMPWFQAAGEDENEAQEPLFHALLDLVGLDLYACPDTNCERVGRLERGAQVPVWREENSWYYVEHAGQSGWLAGLLTERVDAAGVSLEPLFHAYLDLIGLDLHACPDTDCERVGRLEYRTLAPVLREENSWYFVRTEEQEGWLFGWMSARVYRPELGYPGQTYVRLDQSALNLRSCPGTRCESLGTVPRGAVVPVLDDTDGYWYYVKAGNQHGWIANWLVDQYLPGYAEPGYFNADNVYIAGRAPNPSAVEAIEPLIVDQPRLRSLKESLGETIAKLGVMNYRAVEEGGTVDLHACPEPDCDRVGQVSAGLVMPVYLAHIAARAGDSTWVFVYVNDRYAWLIENQTRSANGELSEEAQLDERLEPLFHVRLHRFNLNLRSCGSTQCLRTGGLSYGAQVPVLREENDWYFVRTEEEVGWLAGWLTTRVEGS